MWRWIKNFWQDFSRYFSSDPLVRISFSPIGTTRKSTSNNPKEQLARIGESEAEKFLRDNNYVILQRNIILSNGEVDIIAKDKNVLVFIEVKTRRSENYGKPYEAVTPAKQKRLHKLAVQFMNLLKLRNINYRIDIISIILPQNSEPQITHIKDIK
ncbi:MAG: YraN family protein [Planctomycetaceae bacterium]|jgi:putative endonuclease|nr:YraN family protein [Planctomycetaceae bacterium]